MGSRMTVVLAGTSMVVEKKALPHKLSIHTYEHGMGLIWCLIWCANTFVADSVADVRLTFVLDGDGHTVMYIVFWGHWLRIIFGWTPPVAMISANKIR